MIQRERRELLIRGRLRERPPLRKDRRDRLPERGRCMRVIRYSRCPVLSLEHGEPHRRRVGQCVVGNPQRRARTDLDAAEEPLALLADEIDVHIVARRVVEANGERKLIGGSESA